MMVFLRRCLLLLCLMSGKVWAVLPDADTFFLAVENGREEKITAWLDEGLDPNFQGSQIGTGLMIAAWHGNIRLMTLFVERGADTGRRNRNGEQALQLAAWNGHREAVQWLLDRGVAINRDGKQWGALHYAAFNGHTGIADLLIGRGAEINARSPNGSTPLMLAAREGREDMAKRLIAAGADSKAKNDWGDSALTLSMRYDHYHLGKMISTAEEFAAAVQAPKESFGEATRSVQAPDEIELWLKKIREAEAKKQPTDELRKQLMSAAEKSRLDEKPIKMQQRVMPRSYEPRSIVITASRSKAGAERAQITEGRATVAPERARTKGAETAAPLDKGQLSASQIIELTRQIRLAESRGQPTEKMKKRLFDAVESMK